MLVTVVTLIAVAVGAALFLRPDGVPGRDRERPLHGATPDVGLPSGTPPTLLAAGDIADCDDGAAATARILERHRGVIAALGDLAYPDGSTEAFRSCYAPTWGRFRQRTRPALGNHDVRTSGAAGYFRFFGAVAGPEPQGYYSYELGDWHVVVLNSNCGDVGGCDADSPQAGWLRQDLAAVTSGNILAYWHHPRFSVGLHGDTPEVAPLWRILDEAGADVVLSAHDHDYQRWAPQNADGIPDDAGIRQFVVGTGGAELRRFARMSPAAVEFRQNTRSGVLRLDLRACGYRWTFLATDGSVLDEGADAGTCEASAAGSA